MSATTTARNTVEGTGPFSLDVDPDTLEAAGQRLQLLGEHLDTHATSLGSVLERIGVESWAGATRDAMVDEVKALAGYAKGFPAHFAGAGAALVEAAEAARQARKAMDRVNDDWAAAEDDYTRAARAAQTTHDRAVRDAETERSTHPAYRGPAHSRAAAAHARALDRAASARDTEQDALRQTAEEIRSGLAEQFRRVNRVFGDAVVEGTGALSDGSLCRSPVPPSIVLDALPDLAVTRRRYAEGWDAFTTEQQAEQAGRQTAQQLQSLTGTKLDPAAVDQLTRHADNPAFARGLYDELGPDGLTQLPYYTAITFTPDAGGDVFAGDQEARQRAQEQAAKVADGLAAALVTLSHDPDRGPAIADDLVRTAASDQAYGSAYGLSVILSRADGLDRGFARTVAVGIYDTERTADTAGYWHLQAGGVTGYPPSLFGTDAWYDPMIGVEEMLARDTALAQEFLLGPDGHTDADGDGPANRLEYLYGRRTTAADDGDALGRLLVTATTTRDTGPEGTSTGWKSATILSQTLHAWRRDDASYAVPENARDSLGLVLAVYMPELQNAFDQRGLSAGPIEVGRLALSGDDRAAWGPLLGYSDAEHLVAAVIADDKAFTALVASQQTYLRAQLETLLAAPGTARLSPEELERRITSVARTAGQSWGAILDARNLADIREAMDTDERHQLLVDVLDAVTGIADIPASDFVRGASKLLIEQAISDATSPEQISLHGGSEGHARLEAGSAWTAAQQAGVDEVVSSLFEHGLFDEGGLYADRSPEATLNINSREWLTPDGRLKPASELDAQQRSDYAAWLQASDIGNLQTDVGQAFDNGQKDYQG